jgi:hypothetical protein
MNCSQFDEKLHLLVDPAAPEFLRWAGSAHADGCDRCRRLLEIASGEGASLDPAVEEDLTTTILQRTTGAICDRIDAQLCDWVDGLLPDEDAELLQQHLDRCPGCRNLVADMRELGGVLPQLAEIAPDPRFVRDVLDRTTRAGSLGSRPASALDRWLSGLVRRPRLAQEVAYVAAMLLFLVIGARPGPFVRSGAGNSLPLMDAPLRAAGGFGQGIESVSLFARDIGAGIEELSDRHWLPEFRTYVPALARTGARIDASAGWLARDGSRAAAALIRLDTVEIWSAFVECRDGIRQCWKSPQSTEPSSAPLRNPGQADQPRDERRLEKEENHGNDDRDAGTK